MMKNILLFGLAMVLIAFTACTNDDDAVEEIPGQIPGMGEASGNLEITSEFVLPEGIEIEGEIEGVGDEPVIAGEGAFLKSGEILEYERGSGGQYIAVTLKFANSRSQDKDVVIPAGCLFQCLEEGYQHGVLLQSVRIKIKANSRVKVKLNLYCVNKGRHGSHINVRYVIKGVSGSGLIGKLVTYVQGKKIDVSYFTTDDLDVYTNFIDQIQNLVWSITNGSGITQEGWDFLQSLPSLSD